ncbi:fibronectin type III domain-containing protein, partial [Brumimicrobium sp.]|uniref:fibronectin type III domain-containing protein n=1 Tax=Brumimicrobium sp. TaxID=2029867 RepID=UPI003A95869E
MKKITLFLLFCIFLFKANAQYIQKVYVNEDFSTYALPSGWSAYADPENKHWDIGEPSSIISQLPPNTNNTGMTFPMAYFYYYEFGNLDKNASLETKQFDVSSLPSEGAIKLQFIYQFEKYSYGANFYVEVYNGSSWIEVSHFTEDSANPTYYDADITAVLGGATNAKVRFRWEGNYRAHLFIDKVHIFDVNTICNKPNNLTTSNITPVSMDLSWDAGGSETEWQIIYGQAGFNPEAGEGNSINVSNTTTKTLTGLLPDTAYDIYVRGFCGTNESFLSTPITTSTDCTGITGFPWLENFNTTYNSLPPCWNCVSGSDLGGCFAPSAPTAYPGNKAAKFYGDNNMYLMLPPVFLNGNQQLRFKTLAVDQYSTFTYKVKLSVTSNQPEDFNITLKPSTEIKHTTYQEIDPISLEAYTGYVYLAIHTSNINVDNDPYYFDDFVIEDIPECVAPTNLEVVSKTYDGITVNWTGNGPEYKWEVVYGPQDFNPETEGITVLDDDGETGIQLTDFSLGVHYDFYVRAYSSSFNKSPFSSVGHFTAPCDYKDNFFESFQGLTNIPDCWFKLIDSNSDNAHVRVGNYDDYNGNNSVAELETDTGAVYLISPKLNALSEGSNQLRFFAEGDYFSSFEVGTITNISDASTFTSLATYTTSGAGQYNEYLLPFYEDLTDEQIAFKVSGNNSIHLDNIYWETSTYYCEEPTDVEVTEVGQTYANISWVENGSAEAWKLIYGEPGFDPATEGTIFIDDDEDAGEALTNLTMDTHYEVYISPICDSGDVAITQTPVSFFTGFCNGDVPLNIQGNGLLKVNFVNQDFFSNGNTTSYEVFTDQVVELPQGLEAKTFVVFHTGVVYRTNIWIDFNDDLELGSDELVFQGESLANNPTTLDASFTLPINAALGEHRMRIAAAASGQDIPDPCFSGTDGLVADFQVNITEAPSCFPPTNLSATNIDGTSTQLEWQENASATAWKIIYGPAGFDPTTEGTTLIDNDGVPSVTITGLVPNSSYDFYVKALCEASDESLLVGPESFDTSCIPLGDFSENFDASSNLPDCWSNLIDSPTPPADGFSLIEPNYNTSHSPSNSIILWNSNVPDAKLYLITPELSALIEGDHQIRFFAFFNGNATLDVGLIDTPSDASTFEHLQTITPENGFYEYVVRFDQPYNQKHIAFKASSSTASYSIFIDDVVWEPIPTCIRPSNLTVGDITSNSAAINWDSENNETSWDIVYGEAGFDPLTQGTNITDTDGVEGTTLTGLSATTAYEFYVKANCTAEDESSLSGPRYFKTLCAPFEGLSEDFEETTDLPDCWSRILETTSNVASVGIVDYGGIENSSSVRIFNYNSDASELYLVSPELSNIQNANHQLRFSAKKTANSNLEIGTMTDPNDASTYVAVQQINTTSRYLEYEVAFDGYYPGQYIAFKTTYSNSSSAEVFLDNVIWEPIALCPKPTDLTATNITQNSATLNWTREGNETSWEVIYGAPGFDPETEGNTLLDDDGSPGIVLTGLTENATYEVYVKAVCGTNNESALTGPISFMLSCSSYADFYEDLEDDLDFPSCWSTVINSSGTYAAVVKTYSGGNDNSNSFYLYDSNQDPSEALYLITPELLSLNGGRQFRFSARAYNNPILEVGTMSDPTDASTFNYIETINAIGTIQDFTMIFDETYTDHYLAFRAKFPNQYQSIYIDDVVWEPITNCDGPTDVQISNITESTAKVSWEADGDETAWRIIYGEAGFNPIIGGNTIDVNGTSFESTLSGLTASTTYDVYVQAVCPNGDESSLYGVIPTQFQTGCPPIGSFFENFDSLPIDVIPDCWQKLMEDVSNPGNVIFGTKDFSAYSAPNFMAMYNGYEPNAKLYLVAPMLNNLSDENHQLRFMVKKDAGAHLQVGTMEDANDPATFSAIETIAATSSYQEFSVELGDVDGHQFIAFKAYFTLNSQAVYLDDVVWEPVSCPKPIALATDNFNGNSIDLSWIESGSATSWQIKYDAIGFNPLTEGTLVLDNDGVLGESITGLNPAIEYEFYVKSSCAESETSEWAGPKKFIDAPMNDDICNAITLSLDAGCAGGTYTNTGATLQNNEPTDSCWDTTEYLRTVWFKFVAPESGNVTITTEFSGGSLANNHFKVYEAPTDCSNLQTLGAVTTCSDINVNGATINPSYLTPGAYYYIQVSGIGNLQGTFCIEVQEEADYYYGYDYYDAENDYRWFPENPENANTLVDNVEIKVDMATFTEAIAIKNLVVGPGASLNIESVLTLTESLVNNGALTFKSTATKNGELAPVPATFTMLGAITVERYMKNKRSYRMVSSSVTTPNSIHDNWQEGATGNTDNPIPGFGTYITGSTTDQQNGFDGTATGNPSMFTVDVVNQQFQAITNTDVHTLTAGNPYLLFVRGDRSIDLTNNEASSETVLRATGSLFTGTNIQNFNTEDAGDFVMFGNPYQSTVNLNSVFAGSTNLNTNQFYVFDPSLGDHGAYVTVLLPGGTNTSGSAANEYLQPGQGGQIATATAGVSSVVFNEIDKSPGEFTSTNRPLSGNDMLTVQLYTTENFNNEGPVHDSFGIIFAEGNNNELTTADAVKPMNFYENLGINHNGTYLSIEQRDMPQAAEVYSMFTTGYQQSEYTLKVIVDGLDSTVLYL